MSKKSRRTRAQSRVIRPPQRLEDKQSLPAASPQSTVRQSVSAAPVVSQSVAHEYVKSDLAHIGIIAGALILVIIILTFIPALK